VWKNNEIPDQFTLHQNFPNPFNPTTRIPYLLSNREHVTLKVYDIGGHEISTLVDRNEDAGLHFAEFDASHLASGVYFYRLQVGGSVIGARKALLMR
jgi:hypothetical protein